MTDLDGPLTVGEFREFRADLEARFATKDELEALRAEMAAGFADIRACVEFSTNELRRRFDIVTETFRDQRSVRQPVRLDARHALGVPP